MEIWTILILFFAAFLMEMIDAGLGMGYGTVLSPLLILYGLKSIVVIPSVLISQAFGGLIASIFHHKYKNVNYHPKSEIGDFKTVLIITSLGVIAAVIGAIIAIKIPKSILNIYIGVLITIVGVIMISEKVFKFSWKKIIGLGTLSAFNKGMSGGGYGPIITGGQIALGKECKNSIGCTTAAEVPICLAGFITFVVVSGISDWNIPIILIAGAIPGAITGALLTKRLRSEKIKTILATLIITLGIMLIFGIIKSA